MVGITDGHEPPPVPIGQDREVVEVTGGQHAGLVHDERRPARQLPHRAGGAIGSGVFVEQLGDRIRRHAGLASEAVGGLV